MAGIFENNNSEDLTMKSIKRMIWLSLILLFGASVQAETLTFDYTVSFSDEDPDHVDVGVYPAATAVLDDGDTAGTVTLTLTVGDIGEADITAIYLNLTDDLISTTTGVVITDPTDSDSVSDPDIALDGHKADGGGYYDILIDIDPDDPLNAGDVLVITFTDTSGTLTVDDFDLWATPSGGEGVYLSVVKIQSTGDDLEGSDWVGAVPVPAAAWLFGSALLGLVGVARRRS
jgi:hypothetical protein